MFAVDGAEFAGLAERALRDSLALDLIAAFKGDAAARQRLADRLPAQGEPPHHLRPFLPLMATAGVAESLPSGRRGRPLLQAATLHETLRLKEIDRIAAPLGPRFAAAGITVRVMGGLRATAHYPVRHLRHVHALRLLCPSADIARADAILTEFGFQPAADAREPGLLRQKQSGFSGFLTSDAMPGWMPQACHRWAWSQMTGPDLPASVEMLQQLGWALAGGDRGTQAIVDAYFLAMRGLPAGELTQAAAATGCAVPLAALLRSFGLAELAAEIAAAGRGTMPPWLLGQILRANWHKGGHAWATLFAGTTGPRVRLMVAASALKLAAGKLVRRIKR